MTAYRSVLSGKEQGEEKEAYEADAPYCLLVFFLVRQLG